MVSVPLPPHVVPAKVSAVDAVLKSCAAETDTLASVSRPPLIVPLSYTNDPLVTATVSPLPIVSVPSCAKLGVVPDCAMVSLSCTSMVPRFTCAADALLSVSARSTASVPSLSSRAFSVRDPTVPVSVRIVAPTAFVSVPFVTFKTAPYDDVESVNTIKPSFVKPFSTVRFEVPDAPSPCSRRIAPVDGASGTSNLTVLNGFTNDGL